ncbi:MAG TPA: hypothetical protein VM144_18235 [Aestuariivirga sp.]|nr:hypothetical protein [Aestuariivirga sp.]
MQQVFKKASALLGAVWLVAPASAGPRGADDSVMVFGGVVSETTFIEILTTPWTSDLNPIGVAGISYSHRLGTVNELIGDRGLGQIGDNFTIEGEVGTSARFGDESLGEAWVALYLRFDGLPWNDTVYTTIGANTGLSYLTDISAFERGRDSEGKASELLHYLGPELTFADPENKDLELVLRYHHRSGVFGLFDGVVSGSTFISAGIRVRF